MVALNGNGDFESHPHSRVYYELIDKDGKFFGIFPSALAAAMIASVEWPDQQQDPERTGVGWDVQAAQ